MTTPFPFGYPVRGLWITPTTRNARERLREALPTWQVDRGRQLVTRGRGLELFEEFRGRSPESIRDWKEVWVLDDALLTPLLAAHFPGPIPVEWPEPFPLAGELCPARDWPYDSYLVAYDGRDAALADLARWHGGVALALELGHSGPPRVQAAARALLDGNPAAVAQLAGALEKAGDPRAAAVKVRDWIKKG